MTNSRINAALLVSLRTETIPNHGPGPCCIYFATGPGPRVPVVMIATNNQASIQLAALSVAWLQSMCAKEFARHGASWSQESELLEREKSILQDILPRMFERMMVTTQDIEQRVDMLRTLLDAAERERAATADARFMMAKIQQEVSWLRSAATNAMEMAVKIVGDIKEGEGDAPQGVATHALPQRNLIKEAGGMKRVLDAYHQMSSKSQKQDETSGGD